MIKHKYSIYKGVKGSFGAIQFSFQLPHFWKNEKSGTVRDFTGKQAIKEIKHGMPVLYDSWQSREGAVFLEMTSAIGPNKYDWANKIKLALSVNDIGKILITLHTGETAKLYHDPHMNTKQAGSIKKVVSFSSPNGLKSGVMVAAFEDTDQGRRSHTVPLSFSEVIVLRELLKSAIPKILNW